MTCRCALTGVVIRRGNKQSTRVGIQRLLQRSKDGHLSTYKMGVAMTAILTKSDIISISFENVGQLWPYGQRRIRSGQAKIVIHDRISTKELTLNDKEIVTKKSRSIAKMELNRIKTVGILKKPDAS